MGHRQFDFGYRWLTDIRGSFPQYRSVVNLGEGPKLSGVDFSFQDPKKRLFDRMDAARQPVGAATLTIPPTSSRASWGSTT